MYILVRGPVDFFFKFDTFVFHILSPFFSRKTFPLKDWKKHAGLGLQLTCQSEA